MKINDRVILNTFFGTKTSMDKVDVREDYWKLIGQPGIILDSPNNRILIKFECDIDQFELENHNPIKNSLWILRSDLEIIKNQAQHTFGKVGADLINYTSCMAIRDLQN